MNNANYSKTAQLTAPTTISTILPNGNTQGTYIVAYPVIRYVTTTKYYTGTSPITEAITQTYPPSGTSKDGLVVIMTPPPYTTTTKAYTGQGVITGPVTQTLPASSTDAWTVIVETPSGFSAPIYVTTTQAYTGTSSLTGPITVTTVAPSGTQARSSERQSHLCDANIL